MRRINVSRRAGTVVRSPRHDAGAITQSLEPRRLLATITWDGGLTGNGTNLLDPVNWAGDVLPGPADDAVLTSTGTNPTLTLGGALSVNSLAGGRSINHTAGTLTLASASSLGSYTQSGGTVDAAGPLSATNLTVTAGTFDVDGDVAISGNLQLSNLGTLTNTGTATVGGNFILADRATLGAGGTLTVVGSSTFTANQNAGYTAFIDRSVVLNGNSLWTNQYFGLRNGVTITNNGTFVTQVSNANRQFVSTVGTNTFLNNGTFIQNGLLVAFINSGAGGPMLFNNSATGTVRVELNRLNLQSGGTHAGDFELVAGSELLLDGAHAFQSASTFTGNGRLWVYGGTSNFHHTSVQIPNLRVDNVGVLAGPAEVTVTQQFTLADRATLAAGGTLTVAGSATFTAFDNSGYTAYIERDIVLNGNSIWTNQYFGLRNATATNNGTFTAQLTQDLRAFFSDTGTNAFVNNGTYLQSGLRSRFSNGNGSPMAFNNTATGTVSVIANSLQLLGGGTHAGAFDTSGGGVAYRGNHVFKPSSSFVGTGVHDFLDGSALFEHAAVTVPAMDLREVASLAGPGTITVSEYFRLADRATLAGTGTLIVNGAAEFTALLDSDYTAFIERDVVLNGNSIWTSQYFGLRNATVTNNGTFTSQLRQDNRGFYSVLGNNAFVNNGSFIQSGPRSRFYVGTGNTMAFNNAAGGTVSITANSLQLLAGGTHSGSFSMAPGSELILSGSQMVSSSATFSNDGAVRINGGTVSATGPVAFKTVIVSGGTLDLTGDFTFANPVTVSSGTLAAKGTTTFSSGLLFSGGTLRADAPLAIGGAVDWTGGTLTGNANVMFSGSLIWTGGTMSGIGRTFTAVGSFVTLGGAGDRLIQREWFSDGTINWTGNGDLVFTNGALINRGTMNVDSFTPTPQARQSGGTGSLFRNEGTLTKVGLLPLQISVPFENVGVVNNDEGLMDITNSFQLSNGALTGGIWRVSAGTIEFPTLLRTVDADFEITGGASVPDLSGLTVLRGRIALIDGADLAVTPAGGLLTLEGVMDLSPQSVFGVNGSMRLAGTSQPILRTEIQSAAVFGRLQITGSLDLNSPDSTSRLDADLVGGFDPALGTRFDVITTGLPISNAFDAFFGGTTPSGNRLDLIRPDDFTVSVQIATGAPPPAPQVLSTAFEYETRQAVLFSFDQDVSAFLTRKDYQIVNTTQGTTIPQTAGILTYVRESNVATLVLTNQLPDGDYVLTIDASDIANSAGVPASGAPITLNFFVLGGDSDRDRDVDFADLLVLAQNYGQTGRTYSQGNVDYSPDGLVGFSDLLILAQRYGTSLIRTEPKPSVFGSRSPGRRGLFEPEEAVIV